MRAVYLMVTELGFTMTGVAGLVGVTKQAVSKSLRDIEDEREDPAIDALISRVARRGAQRSYEQAALSRCVQEGHPAFKR